MRDGHAWGFATLFVSLMDFGGYTLKDWLQFLVAVFGIVGSIVGAWKWWRYSKWQIAKRLLEYLNDEEKNISEARHAVLRHIRYGEPLSLEPNVGVHEQVQKALKKFDGGQPVPAEQQLASFAVLLNEDVEVGRRYMNIANQQAATVLLFTGLIAKQRSDPGSARSAWTSALQHNPDDAEAMRCLGELDYEAGNDNEALRRLAKAVQLAPADKALRAETSHIRAEIFHRKRNPKHERNALHEAGDNFVDLGKHDRAATAYARAAEIELTPLNRTTQAPATFKKAYNSYHLARDRDGMDEVRQRLNDLGEDVTALPTLNKDATRALPWPWIRLSVEVLILGTAVAALYLTLTAK
jgi:tetratricopeptide (TPR) repeat protein